MVQTPHENSYDSAWPNKKDNVFVKTQRSSQPIMQQVSKIDELLEHHGPSLEDRYRNGYYDAFRVLADRWQEGQHSNLVFPLLFCARHYVELSIKSLIKLYSELTNERPTGKVEVHFIDRLWSEALRLIQLASNMPDAPQGTLEHVKRVLNEFHQIDSNSVLFRYSTNAAGQSIKTELPAVNAQQIKETMKGLHNFFDGCECIGKDWLEGKRDAASA